MWPESLFLPIWTQQPVTRDFQHMRAKNPRRHGIFQRSLDFQRVYKHAERAVLKNTGLFIKHLPTGTCTVKNRTKLPLNAKIIGRGEAGAYKVQAYPRE